MGIVKSTGQQYVTYFWHEIEEFDPEKIFINLEPALTGSKPRRAFWGSPKDGETVYGWKDWCENEGYGEDYNFDCPIFWHLKEGSKIFQINGPDVSYLDKDNKLLDYISAYDYNRKELSHDVFFELITDEDNDRAMFSYNYKLQFEKLLKDDIVAVELMNACIGHAFINPIETMFNAWDCESIVVLDKSKIVFDSIGGK